MTTNQNIDAIKIELEKAANRDTNIKINYGIDSLVNFLDVTIINENGHLTTCLYHKTTAEPHILPYTSDHPRHVHRNIPYAGLLRAVRICSDVYDFDRELNNAMPVLNELNSQVYHRLHQQLLHQPTRREKQLQAMTQYPIRSRIVLQQKIWDQNIMYPGYLVDSSTSIDFRKQFYKWWRTYYANAATPLPNIKVRLVAATNQILETFFIHTKPPKAILPRMEHG
ncbi:unnamed protein product [Rotaria sp. Silwood2]|nr:unnamed protein product [Rotaria sp. Silwood2]